MNLSSGKSVTGVDVGTSRIVACWAEGGNGNRSSEINAYIELPRIPSVLQSLRVKKVPHQTSGDAVLVYGQWSTTFAELFHSELQRPMKKGFLNSSDSRAVSMMETIVDEVVGTAAPGQESHLVFSVPSKGFSATGSAVTDLLNHQTMMEDIFRRQGHQPFALREGEAVIYSELESNNFSGIGISCGAGLCNISFTYLSVPILDFHVPIGGDWIDTSVASVLDEKATRIRLMKEKSFSLNDPTASLVARSLAVFYKQLIDTVVQEMCSVFRNSSEMPRLSESIPVVVAGGTAMPSGFVDQFSATLEQSSFPLKISSVRLAEDPLNAVAQGCWRYATLNFDGE